MNLYFPRVRLTFYKGLEYDMAKWEKFGLRYFYKINLFHMVRLLKVKVFNSLILSLFIVHFQTIGPSSNDKQFFLSYSELTLVAKILKVFWHLIKFYSRRYTSTAQEAD